MSGKTFTLDTNILVYSVDAGAGIKRDIADAIIVRAAMAPCILTLQAVSEFFAVVTRKRLMPNTEAARFATSALTVFASAPASPNAVRVALSMATAGQASYWDALLLTTAAEAGCTAILTEDLADGTTLAGVRVINPFGAAGLTAEAAALLD